MDNPAWYKDESFWPAFAPVMFDSRRWQEVEALCDCIEEISGHPQPSSFPILDALCAIGRVSNALAERGYPVTGLDLSPSYLAAARENAEGLPCEYIQADIREFSRPGAFCLALNLYNSFGYLESRDEDILMLSRMRQSLRPGGLCVLEMTGKELAMRDFKRRDEWERDGLFISTESSVVGPWEGIRNLWRVSKDGVGKEYSFVQRLYAGTELGQALKEAGFSRVEIYGSLSRTPYDQDADALVALAWL